MRACSRDSSIFILWRRWTCAATRARARPKQVRPRRSNDNPIMKYCRFQSAAGPAFGVVEDVAGREMITRVIAAPLADARAAAAPADARAFEPLPLAQAQLLAPIAPGKIICVGRNYKAHAEELGNAPPPEPL